MHAHTSQILFKRAVLRSKQYVGALRVVFSLSRILQERRCLKFLFTICVRLIPTDERFPPGVSGGSSKCWWGGDRCTSTADRLRKYAIGFAIFKSNTLERERGGGWRGWRSGGGGKAKRNDFTSARADERRATRPWTFRSALPRRRRRRRRAQRERKKSSARTPLERGNAERAREGASESGRKEWRQQQTTTLLRPRGRRTGGYCVT